MTNEDRNWTWNHTPVYIYIKYSLSSSSLVVVVLNIQSVYPTRASRQIHRGRKKLLLVRFDSWKKDKTWGSVDARLNDAAAAQPTGIERERETKQYESLIRQRVKFRRCRSFLPDWLLLSEAYQRVIKINWLFYFRNERWHIVVNGQCF